MIIKNKPFRVLSSSCVQCAWYFPAAVVGYAARPRGYSDFDYASLLRWVRRSPDFSRLEAYQVRCSRYLVMRWAILKAQASPIFPVWDDWSDGLLCAGGVL